jgi:hypothetical protein
MGTDIAGVPVKRSMGTSCEKVLTALNTSKAESTNALILFIEAS